ncbi:MAG: zf-HC2 domain-containing protein [Paracoccaceae bacterium]|nr:zf-HC2 domain-containing protein [Paracoccaceae bacterium]MDG1368987.1 zf-HC2 domain-containing protein [Paracoccaceae bacterium]
MTETTMDKARLAAFVDGELSPEDAAEVVMHLANDPVDQAYVDELMALNVMIADAYDTPLHQPVPPEILATIAADGEPTAKEAPVVSLTGWRRSRRFAAWGGAALAAGIAVFLVVPGLQSPDLANVALGPIVADHPQSLALSELETGEKRKIGDDAEISITASFRTSDKGVCREFAVNHETKPNLVSGIACPAADVPGGWVVEASVAVLLNENTGAFTPASGDSSDPFSAFLDKVGAGRTLTPDEEVDARSNSWR